MKKRKFQKQVSKLLKRLKNLQINMHRRRPNQSQLKMVKNFLQNKSKRKMEKKWKSMNHF